MSSSIRVFTNHQSLHSALTEELIKRDYEKGGHHGTLPNSGEEVERGYNIIEVAPTEQYYWFLKRADFDYTIPESWNKVLEIIDNTLPNLLGHHVHVHDSGKIDVGCCTLEKEEVQAIVDRRNNAIERHFSAEENHKRCKFNITWTEKNDFVAAEKILQAFGFDLDGDVSGRDVIGVEAHRRLYNIGKETSARAVLLPNQMMAMLKLLGECSKWYIRLDGQPFFFDGNGDMFAVGDYGNLKRIPCADIDAVLDRWAEVTKK